MFRLAPIPVFSLPFFLSFFHFFKLKLQPTLSFLTKKQPIHLLFFLSLFTWFRNCILPSQIRGSTIYCFVKSNLGSNSWNRRTIHGWFTHSLLSILLFSYPFSSTLSLLSFLHFFNRTLASKDWFKKSWTMEKHYHSQTIEGKRWKEEEFSWEHCRSFSNSHILVLSPEANSYTWSS